MTNSATILTGTIENLARFNKFGIIVDDTGTKSAILYRDVFKASGFELHQVTDTSVLVVETTEASRGLKVVRVITIDGVEADAPKLQPAVRPVALVDKPKRSLKKRPRKLQPEVTIRSNQFTLKQGEHATGRLKLNFNHEKGFGFIKVTSHPGHPDVFVHVSMMLDSIYQEMLGGREIVFSVGSEERSGEIKYFAVPIDLVATLAEQAA